MSELKNATGQGRDERISSMQNGLNQIKYKPETLNFFSIYNISKTESIVFKNKDSGVVAATTILNAGFYSDIETFLKIIFPASLFEISVDENNKDIFRGSYLSAISGTVGSGSGSCHKRRGGSSVMPLQVRLTNTNKHITSI